ncbi:MAG: ATP-binding protein [Candidatus Aenigmarchaeota archaeon]|nr:ATP-binding protein [Candidatus Aenigmarchaeota archaeon]
MTQPKFVNREKELAFLKRMHSSGKSELVVIYGRRRVGKTELILEFLRGRKGLYFLASSEGDKENLANFKRKASELIDDENFSRAEFGDWFFLFDSLAKNIAFAELARKTKVIVAIDEFPFLIHSNPSIPSIFQRIWELILKNKNVMLILSGSSVSVMEEKVLGYGSPLYGRRTGQWELQPLLFARMRKFFPHCSMEELARIWFVIGGIPEYILKFDPKLGFWQNIRKNFIRKGCYLYREAEFLLKDEFREPKNYVLIFKAIALGKTTSAEICNYTGLDKGMVSKYLETLKNIGIIREEIPVTASPKFRRRLYFLVDPYFNFWFRYVYPNKIELEAYREGEILSAIKKDFQNYSGFMFERLVEHLIREKAVLAGFGFEKIGRWWHKDREIDIVALDENKMKILFCECKWKDNVDAGKIAANLIEKAKLVKWHNDRRKEIYAVFAKSFRKRITKVEGKKAYCFDLKDIEKAMKR